MPLSDSAFANTLVSDEYLKPILSFLCSVYSFSSSHFLPDGCQ